MIHNEYDEGPDKPSCNFESRTQDPWGKSIPIEINKHEECSLCFLTKYKEIPYFQQNNQDTCDYISAVVADFDKENHFANTCNIIDQIKPLNKAISTKVTPISNVLAQNIRRQNVLFVGPSSSGKTVASIQAINSLKSTGWNAVYFDFAISSLNVTDIIATLFSLDVSREKRCVIILDNVQARCSEAKRTFGILKELVTFSQEEYHFLVVGWPTIIKTFENDNLFLMASNPNEIIRSIVYKPNTKYEDSYIKNIQEMSKGDILIAKLIHDFFATNGRFPNYYELSTSVFDLLEIDSSNKHTLYLLYFCASLGMYEIDININYLSQKFPQESINSIKDLSTARITERYFSLGHRSLCLLVAYYFISTQCIVSSIDASIKVVTEYLESAERQQLIGVLERVDMGRLKSNKREVASLVQIWNATQNLTHMIEKLTQVDSTWNNNTSASIFAAEALSANESSEWQRVADYVRSIWLLPGDAVLPKAIKHTNERFDFDSIRKTMINEDALLRRQNKEIRYPNHEIDLDRMHQTWILGLLLGFEGVALNPDNARIRKLKNIAMNTQLPSGAFYPERVPWVTARVILGLCKCGESFYSSDTVRRAVLWLENDYPCGALRADGFWKSGTGTWNSDVQVSVMCISAIISSQQSITSERIKEFNAYIVENEDEWEKPGNEIDWIYAIDVLMSIGSTWSQLGATITRIVAWSSQSDLWIMENTTGLNDSDESCKTPFVCAYLISVVWRIVRENLNNILEGVSIETILGSQHLANPSHTAQIDSDSETHNETSNLTHLREIYKHEALRIRDEIKGEKKNDDNVMRPIFLKLTEELLIKIDEIYQQLLESSSTEQQVKEISTIINSIDVVWKGMSRVE